MVGHPRQLLTDETRSSLYYGVYFLTIGSVMPFVAIWLSDLGISTTMTGAILAAPSLSIVFFNVIIGSWADRLSDWRLAIINCNVLVLILSAGLLIWQSPWAILVLWTLSGLFMISSSPITDAAVLDMTARRGSDYAKIRALGSIGFVVGILIAGMFFEASGTVWFVWVLIACAIARVASAIMLPNFQRVKPPSHIPTSTPTSTSSKNQPFFSGLLAGMTLFRQPGIFVVILGAAMINASHSFNNMYSVLHWTQSGITTTMASVLWTIGVMAEVALMWRFSHIAKRISARHCLLVASVACIVRWTITGFSPGLATLIVLQALHAITFGLTFLASINFIARRVEPNHAAQAQSVLMTITTLLMAFGMWFSGQIYDSWGGHSYWVMTVLAAIGGAFVLSSYWTKLEDVCFR